MKSIRSLKPEWWDKIASDMKTSVVPQCPVTGCSFYKDTAHHIEEFQSDFKIFNRSYQLYLNDLKYRITAPLYLNHTLKI